MFSTGHKDKMFEVLSGSERRRRTSQEKIAIVQQTMETRYDGISCLPASMASILIMCLHGDVSTRTAVLLQSAPVKKLYRPLNSTAAMKQIKELQRLLGKKIMDVDLLKEAVEYGSAKKWIAHAPLLPGGYGLTLISRCLNVSCAQLSLYLHRPADWQDNRRKRSRADSGLVARIVKHIAELNCQPTETAGSGRFCVRKAKMEGAETVNAKRVYTGSCVIITCFWKEKALRCQPVLITEKCLCLKATGDGAKMALSSTAITVRSCGSHSLWTTATASRWTG